MEEETAKEACQRGVIKEISEDVLWERWGIRVGRTPQIPEERKSFE